MSEQDPNFVHIAIITQQISHYHAARYLSASEHFDQVSIIPVANDADFPEFIVKMDEGKCAVNPIFEGYDEYRRAIKSGHIGRFVHEILDGLDPQVVAVAGWSFSESLAAIGWAKSRRRHLIMLSESQAADAARQKLRELLKRRIVMACDAALVGARPHEDYIVDLGMKRANVFHGYDVVQNSHFESGANKYRNQADEARAAFALPERYLLASCRFIPKKNLVRLIEAFSRAKQEAKTSHHLVLLGDGITSNDVRSAIAKNSLNGLVHLPGFKGYADLPAYYGLADGFVHVPYSEQWGLVINEAAAAGLPLVVSSACGATSALVHHGRNGWIVNPYDIEDISTGLVECMTLSENKRARMAANGIEIVADWNVDRFGAGLHAAAQVALESGNPRRLSIFDRLLFWLLSRQHITAVN
jgi:glycosyltransferase involved in cell wall biosynthesis